MLFSISTAFAQGGTTGPLTWKLENGTLTISGNGAMPNYSNGGYYSFTPWHEYRKTIHTIVIHTGVTSIGDYAFSICEILTSVTIPNSVKSIGNHAFADCKNLPAVIFPNSITNLGTTAFFRCSNLTSIILSNNISSIGQSTFAYCTSLTSIEIPGSVINIGFSAFNYCTNLSTITISEGVRNIDSYAFNGCKSLTSILIPNSVASIGYYVFDYCTNLTSIEVESENNNYASENGVLFDKNKTTLISCPRGKVGAYIIPNSVKKISDYAFQDCIYLTSITIPNNLASIGYYALKNCESLISIDVESNNNTFASENGVLFDKSKDTLILCPQGKTGEYFIPNGVKNIEWTAFEYCINLTSITIPNSVTNIGEMAFWGCRNLSSITNFNPIPVAIAFHVVYEVPRSASLKVPMESVSAYQKAAIWKEFNIIGIEVGIESIETAILNIYPNPARGELKIESRKLEIENVVIFDVFGKIQRIENWKMGTAIDISHFPTGVYFVKIRTDVGEVVRMVLKE